MRKPAYASWFIGVRCALVRLFIVVSGLEGLVYSKRLVIAADAFSFCADRV